MNVLIECMCMSTECFVKLFIVSA